MSHEAEKESLITLVFILSLWSRLPSISFKTPRQNKSMSSGTVSSTVILLVQKPIHSGMRASVKSKSCVSDSRGQDISDVTGKFHARWWCKNSMNLTIPTSMVTSQSLNGPSSLPVRLFLLFNNPQQEWKIPCKLSIYPTLRPWQPSLINYMDSIPSNLDTTSGPQGPFQQQLSNHRRGDETCVPSRCWGHDSL